MMKTKEKKTMKNKTNKTDWIIAECCSEADGAELRRFLDQKLKLEYYCFNW